MPHDLLSEKSLLGCLLLDHNAFDEISDLALKRDDFYNPRYGSIYEAIKDLSMANRPIDYVTVCSHLNDHGKLEEVGGQGVILEIVEDQASAARGYVLCDPVDPLVHIIRHRAGGKFVLRIDDVVEKVFQVFTAGSLLGHEQVF